MTPDEERLEISRVVQEQNPVANGSADAPKDAVLIGWFMVTEWLGSDGERWLSRNSSDAAGKRPPTWVVNGYLHDVLHCAWPEGDEE